MAKFTKDDTDDFKKDEFEFDFQDKIYDYEERLDAFFDKADDYYHETPVKYLAEYDKAFKLASEYLTNKIKPFFDKHTELYGPMIYEIYDDFGVKICDRYNNFVMNFPDVKADYIASLEEENEYLQESKVLKQFIIENIADQEVGQTAFANTCGKDKSGILKTIDELVNGGLLKRSKKGNAYHIALAPNITAKDVIAKIDKKIDKNISEIEKIKVLNPKEKILKNKGLKLETEKQPQVDKVTNQEKTTKRELTPEEKKHAQKSLLISLGATIAVWCVSGFFAALVALVVSFFACAFFLPKK